MEVIDFNHILCQDSNGRRKEHFLADSGPVCCMLLHWTSTLAKPGHVYKYNMLIFCLSYWEVMEWQTHTFCLRLNAVILRSFYSFASEIFVRIIQTWSQWIDWANKASYTFKVFLLCTAFHIWKPGVALIDSEHPTLAASSLPFARLMQCIKVTFNCFK